MMKELSERVLCNEDGMRCIAADATHYLVNVRAADGSTQTIMRKLEGSSR